MDLKCKKTICKYNDKYACLAKEIMVGKNVDCETYKKDPDKCEAKLQDVSKTMFEVAPDLSPYRHNKDCKINCRAHCLFNKDGICHANGITVIETEDDGLCATFIEK